MKSEIEVLRIPKKFKGIERDLVVLHNVKRIDYGDFKISL